jgi:5-methylcytosine-specific restriction endonuclease McrA
MPETYKRNPNTNCIVCGKSVYKRPCNIKASNGNVFCCIACYGVSCRRETPCVVCGKPILAAKNKKTCSRGCANTYRTGIRYKLGRPSKDKVKAQQSLKVRLLDARGVKCERCGYNKYEILQVHHKNKDRNNNSMENLELICPNCHYEEHLLEKSWLKGLFDKEKISI